MDLPALLSPRRSAIALAGVGGSLAPSSSVPPCSDEAGVVTEIPSEESAKRDAASAARPMVRGSMSCSPCQRAAAKSGSLGTCEGSSAAQHELTASALAAFLLPGTSRAGLLSKKSAGLDVQRVDLGGPTARLAPSVTAPVTLNTTTHAHDGPVFHARVVVRPNTFQTTGLLLRPPPPPPRGSSASGPSRNQSCRATMSATPPASVCSGW